MIYRTDPNEANGYDFPHAVDWRVRPLVVVVKLWAREHEINDAKSMTISSYSLTLMVIHYLQSGVHPPVLTCLQRVSTHVNTTRF